ncbi:hypothetical protein GCM10009845_12500 [Pedococcus bigeumensis]
MVAAVGAVGAGWVAVEGAAVVRPVGALFSAAVEGAAAWQPERATATASTSAGSSAVAGLGARRGAERAAAAAGARGRMIGKSRSA